MKATELTLHCAADPEATLEVVADGTHELVVTADDPSHLGKDDSNMIILSPESAKLLHAFLSGWLAARVRR